MRQAVKNLFHKSDEPNYGSTRVTGTSNPGTHPNQLGSNTTAAMTTPAPGNPSGGNIGNTVTGTTGGLGEARVADQTFDTAPNIVETKKVEVEEVIKPYEVTEVQPVVDVHRQQTEIHQVLQPIKETEIKPVQIHEQVQPLQSFTTVQPSQPVSPGFDVATTTTSLDVQKTQIQKPPIVREHIHKQVIEEVQPVIYRETIEPHVIKQTVPIQQTIIEPPIITKEVRNFAVGAENCNDRPRLSDNTITTQAQGEYHTKPQFRSLPQETPTKTSTTK